MSARQERVHTAQQTRITIVTIATKYTCVPCSTPSFLMQHITLLSAAGQVECAKLLLEVGTNPNAAVDGTPALHLAVCLGMHADKQETALQLVQLLLDHEALPLDL